MTHAAAPSRSQRLLLSVLVLYTVALFVAALPRPVRPAFLDAPSALANEVLRRFAIRAGISVFQPPRERIVDVLRNDCIYLRGRRAGGAPEWLQPPGGRCVTSGLRIGVPPVEWFLRSLLTGGEASVGELMRQAVIGDWFCHGRTFRDRGLEEVELLWEQPSFDIRTGEERVKPVLYFRWRCDPPGLVAQRSSPSADEVRALWGEEPSR